MKTPQMETYSVKQLAKMAGVSVRTLHLYDQMGLLKPAARTAARYRLYGKAELSRLQQILFYRELDFPLQTIRDTLNDPAFEVVQALESHKAALLARRDRIARLLVTIDNTISHLTTGSNMLTIEELYEGLPKEQAEAYRTEAVKKWPAEAEQAETSLRKQSKADLHALKTEFRNLWQQLAAMTQQEPTSAPVQAQVAHHYALIRQFWGTADSADAQAEAYAGLGQLYVSDERYTATDGHTNPAFADFLSKAMRHFAETKLK